jgi:hypothetical protein
MSFAPIPAEEQLSFTAKQVIASSGGSVLASGSAVCMGASVKDSRQINIARHRWIH